MSKKNSPPKILLIEDDTTLRRALEEYLEVLGYGVEATDQAPKACSILAHDPIDVVITDVHLPGNGFSILECSRACQPRTPVIMLTGSPEPDGEDRAMRRGAFRYLTKPISGTLLGEVVRIALESRERPSGSRSRAGGNGPGGGGPGAEAQGTGRRSGNGRSGQCRGVDPVAGSCPFFDFRPGSRRLRPGAESSEPRERSH